MNEGCHVCSSHKGWEGWGKRRIGADTHLVGLFPFLLHNLQPQNSLYSSLADAVLGAELIDIPGLGLGFGSEWRCWDGGGLIREEVFLVDHFAQGVRQGRWRAEGRVCWVGLQGRISTLGAVAKGRDEPHDHLANSDR